MNKKTIRRIRKHEGMTDQRELGTPSRTAEPDYFRLSAFKPLAISTYDVSALFQQGKLINYSLALHILVLT